MNTQNIKPVKVRNDAQYRAALDEIDELACECRFAITPDWKQYRLLALNAAVDAYELRTAQESR